MKLAWSLLVLVACKASGDDYPINPGGDDVVINPMADAKLTDGPLGDGVMLTGRVCVLADLRTPSACASTGAANITVTLGGTMALTADDGAFMMLAPGGVNLVWRTSGTGLVSSVVPFSTSNILPMIAVDLYNDIQSSNGVIINSGEGSIVVFTERSGLPLAGVTATVTPSPTYLSMGDTNDALTWVQGGTGNFGVNWTPGVAAGTATVTLAPAAGSNQVVMLPVEDGAITYATVVL